MNTERLLNEHIIPNADYIEGPKFREEQLYTYDVDELLRRNELQIKKVFDSYIYPNKKYITLKECIEIINKRGDLKIIETTIGYCYASSLMIIIDPVKD
jgi:hypothetical protein